MTKYFINVNKLMFIKNIPLSYSLTNKMSSYSIQNKETFLDNNYNIIRSFGFNPI